MVAMMVVAMVVVAMVVEATEEVLQTRSSADPGPNPNANPATLTAGPSNAPAWLGTSRFAGC